MSVAAIKVTNHYDRYVLANYTKVPCIFKKGKGIKLWDVDGREYLDFFSGWGVSGLGHCPTKVVSAIKNQSGKLLHVPNNFYNNVQGELAQIIIKNAFPGKVFFCNSGAEAVETAIKLARRWSEGRFEIITMKSSFHGRTMGAMTATAQPTIHKGFEPVLEGFKYAAFNDIDSVKEEITSLTSAIMFEPIQGEGGINVASTEFMEGVKALCEEHNLLLILDEVQSGIGRTGKMFAYQHYGIKPDVMTLAKSLGGGIAIGAAVISEKVAHVLAPGTHASTFGGNPLACRASIAVFKTISQQKLLKQAQTMGKYLRKKLDELKFSFSNKIREVRGIGLMLGMELVDGGEGIVSKCFDRKLIINCTQKNVLRIMPPLCVTKKNIDHATAILKDVFAHEI